MYTIDSSDDCAHLLRCWSQRIAKALLRRITSCHVFTVFSVCSETLRDSLRSCQADGLSSRSCFKAVSRRSSACVASANASMLNKSGRSRAVAGRPRRSALVQKWMRHEVDSQTFHAPHGPHLRSAVMSRRMSCTCGGLFLVVRSSLDPVLHFKTATHIVLVRKAVNRPESFP